MEDNFNNRDFEQFVKQNADQYRMFPSEKVWKNIHSTLHTRRRWYGLGLFILLLTAGIVTWVMLTPSIGTNQTLAYKPATAIQNTSSTDQKNNNAPILITAENSASNKKKFNITTETLQKNIFISTTENNRTSENLNEKNSFISKVPNNNEPVEVSIASVPVELTTKNAVVKNKLSKPGKEESNNMISRPEINIPLIAENKKEELPAPDKKAETEKISPDPLKMETAEIARKKNSFGKKLSWEIFITPTISYRDLSENKDFINNAQANNNIIASVAGINSLVTHKPDMGLQLGFKAGYPVTKNMKITGGMQFNVSKYDIRASFSPGEVATIALNVGAGSNSVSTISNYRNSGDSKADWLRNLYFSASIPVGIELKLSGNRKTEFGISGTIQPTYVLSNKAYLLSTDYKNYVEVPSLIRRWNINTGFEVYAGFNTGNINWRVGPQVRYQLKSSFQEKYPVKEHLFDFGLKLGIMLKK